MFVRYYNEIRARKHAILLSFTKLVSLKTLQTGNAINIMHQRHCTEIKSFKFPSSSDTLVCLLNNRISINLLDQ